MSFIVVGVAGATIPHMLQMSGMLFVFLRICILFIVMILFLLVSLLVCIEGFVSCVQHFL